MQGVTLDNCHEEPIRTPGSIQSHGYLVVLDLATLTVCGVSENVTGIFDLSLSQIIGVEVGVLLGQPYQELLAESIAQKSFFKINPFEIQLASNMNIDVVASIKNQHVLLDIEQKAVLEGASFEVRYLQLRNLLNKIVAVESIVEVLENVAQEVRDITEFDRVMIYRFDPDYNGEVVAESKRDGLNSFLQQHFPESDIPSQARALYVENPLRLLADVDAAVVPFYPQGFDVDLSSSVLRSVSPIHCQYLRNMGVKASMSISLTIDGKLWGLIACHHYQPHVVPLQIRESAAYLGLILSHFIAVWSRGQTLAKKAQAQTKLSEVLTAISAEADYLASLRHSAKHLMAVVDATGMAWNLEGQIECFGETPAPEWVEKIHDWASEESDLIDSVVHSKNLSGEREEFAGCVEFASGVLMLPIHSDSDQFILWFRKELIHTKNWGGKPEKTIEFLDDGSHRLMPRASFELWKENVRGHSIAWDEVDIEIALTLRNAVMNFIVQRTAHLNETNKRLEMLVAERTTELTAEVQQRRQAQVELKQLLKETEAANHQLEQFAYIASHDLQEPLRRIQSFGSRIQNIIEKSSNTDPDLEVYLDRMVSAAERMQNLIKGLLSYSRIDKTKITFEAVDVSQIITEVLSDLKIMLDEKGATIHYANLGQVRGDKGQLYRVFQNLIHNAVKFSRQQVPPQVTIEIESETSTDRVYRIADNGIGFENEYGERIFELFQRLHGRGTYEGTGLGLAICKKILEQHGGSIWANSQPGQGTSMYVLLKRQ